MQLITGRTRMPKQVQRQRSLSSPQHPQSSSIHTNIHSSVLLFKDYKNCRLFQPNIAAMSTRKTDFFPPNSHFLQPSYKLKGKSIKFITSSVKTTPEINDRIYYHDPANTVDFPHCTISLFFALFTDH